VELAGRVGEGVRVRIAGSARALVEVAVRAGLRLEPVPGLLSDGLAPPDVPTVGGYTLD
jgi:hypothetical protein